MANGNAVIGQSGGPTAVINQSLVGCIEGLRSTGIAKQIFGAFHGVRGVLEEQFIDLTDTPEKLLERIAQTPSAALKSTRDKPDEAYCKNILSALEKRNIRYFFYIGGNDSSDTCHIVNQLSKQAGYDLAAFHIPKTIDNDLVQNDHTPGYPSAARFVACAFLGDNLDNQALPGIKINVVMGRHAGFLTAASALARQSDDDGPHLIYVPEQVFDLQKFVADVDCMYTKHGRCLIAVSEGVHSKDGSLITTQLTKDTEKDAHGNVQLSGTGALGDFLVTEIKSKLGKKLRVRADTFGYLQRCYPIGISSVDAKEAREAGRSAAMKAADGIQDGSIAIQRKSDDHMNDPYEVTYELIKLDEVAGKTRTLPQEFMTDDNNISPAFVDYAKPLVGELPIVEKLG